MLFYEDLLALPAVDNSASESHTDTSEQARLIQIQTDHDTVVAVDRRLCSMRSAIPESGQNSSLLALLQRKHPDLLHVEQVNFDSLDNDSSIQPYTRLLNRVQIITDQIQNMTPSKASTSQLRTPLLSLKECQSLIRVCVRDCTSFV